MKVVITLGSNTCQQANINKAKELLRQRFDGIRFSDEEWTDPVGIVSDRYLNCIGHLDTRLSLDALKTTLKEVERLMGDSHENHQRGTVIIDIDIIRYGERKIKDIIWRTIATLLIATASLLPAQAQPSDPDPVQLDKAIAYFTSAKYHEALLIFQRLDKRYKLNDRFRAYIGLCYYYEWDYKSAAQYLDEVIPRLGMLAPHERSVYYFAAAESHFNLKRYPAAITHYEKALEVCYDNEKGDIYYRLGLCHMFAENWQKAIDNYALAEQFYRRHRNTDDLKARLAQLQRMKAGCQARIDEQTRADSSTTAKAKTDSTVTVASPTTPQNTPRQAPPVDDYPQKEKQKQKDAAPINLEDLYRNKIDVEQ